MCCRRLSTFHRVVGRKDTAQFIPPPPYNLGSLADVKGKPTHPHQDGLAAGSADNLRDRSGLRVV